MVRQPRLLHPLALAFLVIAVMAALLIPTTPVIAQAPANDNFGAATAITGLPMQFSGNTDAATVEPGEPTACSTAKTVWYTFTPSAPTTLVVDTGGVFPSVGV